MEQKAAHTPAPWIADLGEAYRVRAQQDGGQVAIMMNLKGRHGLGGRRCGDEVAANALLIAAAPELLAACKSMIEWDDREKDHAVDFSARMSLCEAAFNAARAAIAKATRSDSND